MIRTFIGRLLGGKSADSGARAGTTVLGKRVEIAAATHQIDPTLLDERAVRVVTTLQDAGHEAYVVGGAVRDLLVGRKPKDFDVATSATPEQVKALFRRAFIIGRRFRIVHVIHGRGREHEVVEVSTFRALVDAADAPAVAGNEKTSRRDLAGQHHAVDASGRVLRDNVWGPQVEDAARRDFTVNAMYYDPRGQVVVDYHHGFKDARARVLRMIGDAPARYREDPVRILRVVRIAAKLGFAIEPKTRAPLKAMAPLLKDVPPSRLFDEMLKLLQTGHAQASVQQLDAQGLGQGIFPVLDAALHGEHQTPQRRAFVDAALADTDLRVLEGKSVAPSFLLACLLWHDVLPAWQRLQQGGEHATPALQQAIDEVFDARIGDISGRGKLAADMREIWTLQQRFERRTPAAAASLIERPRFRAAFDFLRLRADAGEVPTELAEWWEDFSMGSDADREALLTAARAKTPPQARRGAREARAASAEGSRGDSAADADVGVSAADTPSSDAAASDAPKRRRRRRRKPAGARADADGSAAGPAGSGGDAPGE